MTPARCARSQIGIDKSAIKRGRNAEQEAGEGISASTAAAARLSRAAARVVGIEREAAVLAGIGIRQRSLKAPVVFADCDRVLAENLNEVVCNLIDICNSVGLVQSCDPVGAILPMLKMANPEAPGKSALFPLGMPRVVFSLV